ncbi:hypothetical protein Bca4012_036635 [Brassica carinata]
MELCKRCVSFVNGLSVLLNERSSVAKNPKPLCSTPFERLRSRDAKFDMKNLFVGLLTIQVLLAGYKT